jgi:hypothetical protein
MASHVYISSPGETSDFNYIYPHDGAGMAPIDPISPPCYAQVTATSPVQQLPSQTLDLNSFMLPVMGAAPSAPSAPAVLPLTPSLVPMPASATATTVPPSYIVQQQALMLSAIPTWIVPSSIVYTKPIQSLRLKPQKWSFGLIGNLKEMGLVDSKGKEHYLIEIEHPGWVGDVAGIKDSATGQRLAVYEFVYHSFHPHEFNLYSPLTSDSIVCSADLKKKNKRISIGKLEELGCLCTGVYAIRLGKDKVYYYKSTYAFLRGGGSMVRMASIFSERGELLIHWSEPNENIDVYTDSSDVPLLLLIIGKTTRQIYVGRQQSYEGTMQEIDARSKDLKYTPSGSAVVNHNHYHSGIFPLNLTLF